MYLKIIRIRKSELFLVFHSDTIHQGYGLSYLFMILLQATQLILKILTLHLQVSPAGSQLVQDLVQAINISFHILTETTFCLKPKLQEKIMRRSCKIIALDSSVGHYNFGHCVNPAAT